MLISYLDSSLHTDSKTVSTFYFYSLLKKNHWKFNDFFLEKMTLKILKIIEFLLITFLLFNIIKC